MQKPQFTGQRADETVNLVCRQHIIALSGAVLMFVIGIVAAVAIALTWQSDIAMYGAAGLSLIAAAVLFWRWVGWYFSVYIVTNQRVRQVKQKGLFKRSVIEINLDRVQNISYKIPGMVGSLCNFGMIILQTRAGDLVMRKIPHCEQIYVDLADAVQAATGAAEEDEDA